MKRKIILITTWLVFIVTLIPTIQASLYDNDIDFLNDPEDRMYCYFLVGKITNLTIEQDGTITFCPSNMIIFFRELHGDKIGAYLGHMKNFSRFYINNDYVKKIGIISENFVCCYISYKQVDYY